MNQPNDPVLVPACPACGSRRVTRIQTPVERPRNLAPGRKPQLATSFHCAQCGRDRTNTWVDLGGSR